MKNTLVHKGIVRKSWKVIGVDPCMIGSPGSGSPGPSQLAMESERDFPQFLRVKRNRNALRNWHVL